MRGGKLSCRADSPMSSQMDCSSLSTDGSAFGSTLRVTLALRWWRFFGERRSDGGSGGGDGGRHQHLDHSPANAVGVPGEWNGRSDGALHKTCDHSPALSAVGALRRCDKGNGRGEAMTNRGRIRQFAFRCSGERRGDTHCLKQVDREVQQYEGF